MNFRIDVDKRVVAAVLTVFGSLFTAGIISMVSLGNRTLEMVQSHEERLQAIEFMVEEMVPRPELEAYQTLLLGRLDRIEDKLDRWVERH